jgi:hypothetical protein
VSFVGERTCMSWWFPRIEAAGLPVPRTVMVETAAELGAWLEGERADGDGAFLVAMRAAVAAIGTPCFLRTGHTSAKHDWTDTCHLPDDRPGTLEAHVSAIVEFSYLAGFPAVLPHDVWAVRKLLDTEPLFRAFRGMPITREFRVFVRDDDVEHVQPYWPPDAILDPDRHDWRKRLAQASRLDVDDDNYRLGELAGMASAAVGGGYWSVDLLQDRRGEWWLTDMAEGDRSFRWQP